MSTSKQAMDAQLYERALVDIKAGLATLNATLNGIKGCDARSRDVWEALRIVSLLKEINSPTFSVTPSWTQIVDEQNSVPKTRVLRTF